MRSSARWLLAVLLLPGAAAASDSAETLAKRLEAVRAELQQLAAVQQQIAGDKAVELKALRAADRELAAAQRGLAEAEAEHARQRASLEELERQRSAAAARLEGERDALATLLRSLYAGGRHEQIKRLLAQDNLDRLNRTLVYQRYLQRDRQRRADALRATLGVLADAEAALLTQAAIAARAEAELRAAFDALAAQRRERQVLIAELDRRHHDATQRQQALGRDEAALTALLDSLQDVFADIPADIAQTTAIDVQRGRLPRPLPGKLRAGFAGNLPDGRASKGWWIEADAGAEVIAVAHGRVAFADWMRGYGLLLILDHGDGYMSLYAGGDALLAEAGDWIAAGQVVAFAGQSGGFAAAGLYFELRRHGEALDPAIWLQKR